MNQWLPTYQPPGPLTATAFSLPAGTLAAGRRGGPARNATRHATHVYEMATYANSIKVLRGGAHCLPISLPDKPVWCKSCSG